jgi:hypothetical protein
MTTDLEIGIRHSKNRSPSETHAKDLFSKKKKQSEIARCGQEVLATSHFGCMEISLLKNWLLLFFGLD